MVAKRYKDPKGGLNAAGRKKFGVKAPVRKAKAGSKNFRRRVSFAARFSGVKGSLKDKKGRPTRLALALKKWGFRNKDSARKFAQRHKKKT
tara:strand:+ start:116 stop:388 length:273 start_codon:yes stop_codon:yes gene_type:complete